MDKQRIFLNKTLVISVIILFFTVAFQPAIAIYSANEEVEVNSNGELSISSLINRKIIYVDDDNTEGPWDGTIEHPFQYIMDAVNIIENGDTIFVFNGVYNQTLEIDFDFQMNFSLKGENKENTHIDGDLEFYWSKVSAKIEGFTFWHDIYLGSWWTHNNLIKNNIIYGNLTIYDSKNNRIENNIFNNGYISLREAEYNIIVNNSFSLGGIFCFRSSFIENWNSHIIENNTINGRPIRYYINTDNTIVPEDTGQLILANCTDFTIRNLNIENVEYGIQFAWSTNNIISNCIIRNGSSEGSYLYRPAGIFLYRSNNNEISNTEIKKFFIGIDYDGSGYNIITNCTLIDSVVGIEIVGSSKNKIIRNIINNHRDGIALYSGSNIIIKGNIISNNRDGIYCDEASDYTISSNNISSNTEYGIYIYRGFAYKIIKNNFINNEINAYLYYSKGLWFRNYWNRSRSSPKIINGTTEFFLIWYLLYESIPYIQIPRPPSLKIKRWYDLDWFPAKSPYEI